MMIDDKYDKNIIYLEVLVINLTIPYYDNHMSLLKQWLLLYYHSDNSVITKLCYMLTVINFATIKYLIFIQTKLFKKLYKHIQLYIVTVLAILLPWQPRDIHGNIVMLSVKKCWLHMPSLVKVSGQVF